MHTSLNILLVCGLAAVASADPVSCPDVLPPRPPAFTISRSDLPVYELWQSDFAQGTLRLNTSGVYKFMEDVHFNPNRDDNWYPVCTIAARQDLYCGAHGPSKAYQLGFFAGITLEGGNIHIDLNGHTFAQHPEHALQQRFFALIELADQPFIPRQGPAATEGAFGLSINSCTGCSIFNGKLGRSSHHGIHGNDAQDLVVDSVVFEDYEVAAISCNGCKRVEVTNVTANGNFDQIPVRATYSAARFITIFWDAIKNVIDFQSPNHQAFIEIEAKYVALKDKMNQVFDEVINGDSNQIVTEELIRQFALPVVGGKRLIDGNAYGMTFHRTGVLVGPFTRMFDGSESADLSQDILITDTQILNTAGNVNEVIAMKHPESGLNVDVAGGTVRMNEITDLSEPDGVYISDALHDLRFELAYWSDGKGGNHPGLVEARSAKRLGTLNIDINLVKWARGEIPRSDVTEQLICNIDSMNHKQKGVIGLFLQQTFRAQLQNVVVENTLNQGAAGLDVCGAYTTDQPLTQEDGHMGYTGSQARAVAIAGSAMLAFQDFSINGVEAFSGSAYGIDAFNDVAGLCLHRGNVAGIVSGRCDATCAAPNVPDRINASHALRFGASVTDVFPSFLHLGPAVPALCDLAQSCSAGACKARQSTYYRYAAGAAAKAVDGDASTCAETADAIADENAQWVRVDLGAERLVGTVRFSSPGASAGDLAVFVSDEDAGSDEEVNPTAGGAPPTHTEACEVEPAGGADEFQALCAVATKGRFVFVARSKKEEALAVCEVEVFEYACEAEEELTCGPGLELSPCAACRQCVPCAPGSFSDDAAPCKPCPASKALPAPYSPEGSTSEFQCAGHALLEGSSSFAVTRAAFDEAQDAWVLGVELRPAQRVDMYGLAAIFLSRGGDALPATAGTFHARNFPCRADASRGEGEDTSAALAETACCLQDLRDGYLLTDTFRAYTDTLDLIAANDVCDGPQGSSLLVGGPTRAVEVLEGATEFVDTQGDSFAAAIRVLEGPRRLGAQTATVIIPDAELYKISRPVTSPVPGQDYLTDSRELFIGLLDMLPTGTRVLDAASQQVAVVLTRTQYGSFAAYGEQNIDYDFISYLNARAHRVNSQYDARRTRLQDHYYLEITYVYDSHMSAADESRPVEDLSGVELSIGGTASTPCDEDLPAGFEAVVEDQACGPTGLDFSNTTQCPQVSIPDDKFARIYIPLPLGAMPSADPVSVSFKLNLTDASGRASEVDVSMDISVADFVSWCDADEGSIDLAERVVPSITIGSETDDPPRVTRFGTDDAAFDTQAETLQDGLITLELSLNETDGLDNNLQVFFEDVLVIHINPGSVATAVEIKDEGGPYIPTYTYDPDSRDATLHIPDALRAACSNMSYSESFFGCAYKHALAEEQVTNPEWSYLVGSSGSEEDAAGTTAQDFMETMLGAGTARVAARELGREFEAALRSDGVGTRKKIGLWINPGHVWGETVHNSKYSLSQHVVIYVLFGVRSGIDGVARRMMLQAGSDGTATLVSALKNEVSASAIVTSSLDSVIAIEVAARMLLPAAQACLAPEERRAVCSAALSAAVAPHASAVAAVHCVSVRVPDCDDRRAAASAQAEASVEAVIALEDAPGAFLDIDAVVESGNVLSMVRTDGTSGASPPEDRPVEIESEGKEPAEDSGPGSNVVTIAAAVGAVAGVGLAGLLVWGRAGRCCGGRDEEVPECGSAVMSTMVKVGEHREGDRNDIESILFFNSETPDQTKNVKLAA